MGNGQQWTKCNKVIWSKGIKRIREVKKNMIKVNRFKDLIEEMVLDKVEICKKVSDWP